jgi:hypothetical protein
MCLPKQFHFSGLVGMSESDFCGLPHIRRQYAAKCAPRIQEESRKLMTKARRPGSSLIKGDKLTERLRNCDT